MQLPFHGRVAEWLMAADCKSADLCLRKFESFPFHHKGFFHTLFVYSFPNLSVKNRVVFSRLYCVPLKNPCVVIKSRVYKLL